MTDHENPHEPRTIEDFDPELRDAAARIARALRAEVPLEVARRHEALLRERAAANVVPFRPRSTRRRAVKIAAASLAASLALGAGTAAAADDAVPGDALYGVDRAVERLELVIARSPSSEATTHLEHASERLDEASVLVESGRPEDLPDVVEDANTSLDRAQAASDQAVGQNADDLREHVLGMISKHVARLEAVRDRLAADGHANPRALEALERAIANADKARGKAMGGRPDDTGKPSDAGRPDDPGKPSDAGRPDDPGQSGNEGQQGNQSPQSNQGPQDNQGQTGTQGSQGSPSGSSGGPPEGTGTGSTPTEPRGPGTASPGPRR